MFMEQRCLGTLQVWAEPFTKLRLPKVFNLRTDPYEFAERHLEQLLRLVFYTMTIFCTCLCYCAGKWAATSSTSRRSRSRTASPSTMR